MPPSNPVPDQNNIIVAAIVYDKASEAVDLKIDNMDRFILEMKKQISPDDTGFDDPIPD